jgi:putative copper resistance protein D
MQSRAPSQFHSLRDILPLVFILSLLLISFAPIARSRQHDMHDMPDMAMSGDAQHMAAPAEGPIDKAKRLADKQESEFNHHLAGFFIFLAGMLLLVQERLVPRWPLARYAWPLCFFISGLFVFVFSDTELWPWGNQSLFYALSHEPEDLQHKVFAIILLALGVVEFQRLLGRWKAPWLPWTFPALSLVGAVLLLFHSHAGGMHGPNAMRLMERIQSQHRWYASIGFAIVVTKGLSEMPIKWRDKFDKIWPVLLIILGTSLAVYEE